MEQWVNLAIQAGGAVSVCGMFLWYLVKTGKADQVRRAASREDDEKREARFFEQLDRQTAYLQGRDAQSREIAMSGHEALREVASEVAKLRATLHNGSGFGKVAP